MLLDNIDIGRLISFGKALGAHLPEIKRVVNYLAHYGYIDPETVAVGGDILNAIAVIKTGITRFRSISGLAGGDQVDVSLIEKMAQPRCGYTDALREVAEAARWRKTSLTYFVAAYVNGLSQADQNDIIRMAWQSWQEVAAVSLSPAMSQASADIVIATGRGAGQGFDGPSGTLAYAYLPTGDDRQLLMRFDLDETWIKGNPQGGILMLNVACHEFGHLLGLEHSRISSALMAPFYAPGISKPQTNDDIPRIRALYGAATSPPTIPPTTPPPGGPTTKTLTVEITGENAKLISFK